MNEAKTQIYEIYIHTTPARLWEAITKSEFTQKYYFATAVESEWRPGSTLVYRFADGSSAFDAVIEEVEPGKRLVHTFKPKPEEWPSNSADQPSRVTYEIEQLGPSCLLRVTHEHATGETAVTKGTNRGWQIILSGLKTLLETGEPLAIDWPAEVRA